MGTIALAAVTAPGVIGTTAGSAFAVAVSSTAVTIGGLIDSTYTFPALRAGRSNGSVGSAQLSPADEGTAIARIWGGKSRVPCPLIFTGLPRQVGGVTTKRGAGAAVSWILDGAYLLAQSTPVLNVEELYFDGRLAYVRNRQSTVAGNFQTNITVDWTSIYFAALQSPGVFFPVRWQAILEIADPDAVSARFTDFISSDEPDEHVRLFFTAGDIPANYPQGPPVEVGYPVVRVESPTRIVIDIFEHIRGQTFGNNLPPANHPFNYGSPPTTPVTGVSWKIQQTLNQWRTRAFVQPDPVAAGKVEFSNGSPTQAINGVLEGAKGVGQTHAHRGSALFAFIDLNSSSYGSRYPNVEAVLDVSRSAMDLTVTDLCSEAIASSELDVAPLVGFTHLGYWTAGTTAASEILQPFMLAHDLMVEEHSGKLWFDFRANADVVAVRFGDLGARQNAAAPRAPLQMEDDPEARVPGRVLVEYARSDQAYEVGIAQHVWSHDVREATETVGLRNVTLTTAQARGVARRIARLRRQRRQKAKIELGPRYLRVTPNTVLDLSATDQTGTAGGSLFRVVRVDRGTDLRIACDCVAEAPEPVTSPLNVETDGPPPPAKTPTYSPPYMRVEVVPLLSSTGPRTGYYVAAAPEDPGARYVGATVFRSIDGGETWANLGTLSTPATIGYVEGTPLIDPPQPYPAAGPASPDTISVVLAGVGSLESVSTAQIAAGANRAMVGGEVIQFETATLTANSPRTYDVEDITSRGALNTFDSAFAHAERERFVLLDNLPFYEVDRGDTAATHLLRVVPVGLTVDDIASIEVAIPPRDEWTTADSYDVGPVNGRDLGDGRVRLDWSDADAGQAEYYEVRVGPHFPGAEAVARVQTPGASIGPVVARTRRYWVAARYGGGLYSEMPRFVDVAAANPDGSTRLVDDSDLVGSAKGTHSSTAYDATEDALHLTASSFAGTYTLNEVDVGAVVTAEWLFEVDSYEVDVLTVATDLEGLDGLDQEARYRRGLTREPSSTAPGGDFDVLPTDFDTVPHDLDDWHGYGRRGNYGRNTRTLVEMRFHDGTSYGAWERTSGGIRRAQKAQARVTLDRIDPQVFEVYVRNAYIVARS